MSTINNNNNNVPIDMCFAWVGILCNLVIYSMPNDGADYRVYLWSHWDFYVVSERYLWLVILFLI